MDSTSAVYVYCVVKSTRRPPRGRVPRGIDGGTTPEALALAGGLWLIVADVPLDVYGPGRLEPKLQDLEWVAQAAIAHEGVIEHFARAKGTTVVPLKLFTMFSSRARAAAELSRQRAALARVVRRVAGCEEWGLRITRSAAGAPARSRRGPAVTGEAPASGAAYLAARREARDAERAAHGSAVGAAEAAYHRLGRLARDSHVRDRAPEPGTNPPLLEAAFLVPARGRARFRSEARRQSASCAAAGADMTLTGPWPPYNFVSLGERG